MSDCCNSGCSATADALKHKQRGVLITVLLINAIMFVVIVIAAQLAGSSAMFADSLDFMGDALTYGLSLLVVAGSVQAKAKVAIFKGGLIGLAALAVVAQLIYKLFYPSVPVFGLMGVFALISLAANSVCLYLLTAHKTDDVNMSSVWECSRNDILTNLSVLATAVLVWLTQSGWPDLMVAALLSILLLRSSFRVLRSGFAELKA